MAQRSTHVFRSTHDRPIQAHEAGRAIRESIRTRNMISARDQARTIFRDKRREIMETDFADRTPCPLDHDSEMAAHGGFTQPRLQRPPPSSEPVERNLQFVRSIRDRNASPRFYLTLRRLFDNLAERTPGAEVRIPKPGSFFRQGPYPPQGSHESTITAVHLMLELLDRPGLLPFRTGKGRRRHAFRTFHTHGVYILRLNAPTTPAQAAPPARTSPRSRRS